MQDLRGTGRQRYHRYNRSEERFAFVDLPVGLSTLRVSKDGFEPTPKPIEHRLGPAYREHQFGKADFVAGDTVKKHAPHTSDSPNAQHVEFSFYYVQEQTV